MPHNPNNQFLVISSIMFCLQRFSNAHVSQSEHVLMGTKLFGQTRSDCIDDWTARGHQHQRHKLTCSLTLGADHQATCECVRVLASRQPLQGGVQGRHVERGGRRPVPSPRLTVRKPLHVGQDLGQGLERPSSRGSRRGEGVHPHDCTSQHQEQASDANTWTVEPCPTHGDGVSGRDRSTLSVLHGCLWASGKDARNAPTPSSISPPPCLNSPWRHDYKAVQNMPIPKWYNLSFVFFPWLCNDLVECGATQCGR